MAARVCYLPFLLFCSLLITSEANHVPALYIFGDSDLDNGNNNNKDTLAKANYPPYGLDFPLGITGRFTNGFTIADYLAQFLKTSSPPPVMAPTSAIRGSSGGCNYASASAGILPETGNVVGTNLNLTEQVRLFREETVGKILLRSLKTQRRVRRHLSHSVFLILIGSNDYAMNYLLPQYYNTSGVYDPQQFGELLINHLGGHLQELYRLGGRKFVVFEIGPLGCLPVSATSKTESVDEMNALVSIFNHKLHLQIQNLTSTLQNSTFVIVKTFDLVNNLVENPSRYGFKDSTNPCCATNQTLGTCIRNGSPCRDRNAFVFWDGAHHTDAVNRVAAREIFNGSKYSIPMNVFNLVHLHEL